jgi:hypothetical protein
MGLKRGPFSLVSTAEELLGRTSSDSCLERAMGISCDDYATPLLLAEVGTDFADKLR